MPDPPTSPSTEFRTTFCRICEAQCGLRVGVADNRIVSVEPDHDHVVSQGYVCIKGLEIESVRASPDRLTTPLKKVDGRHVPISWDQALQEIGAKVRQLRRDHGDDSVGLFFGNPISFSILAPIWINAFVRGLGTAKFFNTGSLDCNNKFAVSERLYGSGMSLTFPDVDRTRFLMVIGGNPSVSKMSFIHLPNPMKRLGDIVARGGRLVFVNPRRTESAKEAGEQLFIRPDTDVFFLAAFLREILKSENLADETIRTHMKGIEALPAVVAQWTPEKQATVTGVSADTLRELVAAYLAADGAALYASTGLNQGRNGVLAFWFLEVINAITGNLDRRGGTLMGEGIIDYAKLLANNAPQTRVSRIDGVKTLLEAFPSALIADEILTPGEGQMRGFFVVSGNPLLSATRSERLEQAMSELELLVSIEIFRNETANHADYILPGTHFAERPDIPFTFLSFSGLTPIPWFQYTDPLVTPPGLARDEMWTLGRLGKVCDAPLFGSRAVLFAINAGAFFASLPWLGKRLAPTAQRILSLLCRIGGQGSLKALRKFPHGKLRPALQDRTYLGKRVVSADGKVDLAPAEFVELAESRLVPSYDGHLEKLDTLRLITKRERYSHNTWAHNIASFVKGRRSTNFVYVHPDDAASRNLANGDIAEITSDSGRVRVPVTLSRDMMPGTIALPHGWGHQSADGLTVAQKTTGANANVLAADGPDSVEPISGMTQFNGIPVELRAITAPSP
ncbi:MAG: anaerobic selenocysteine-containing dehydrogenase [Hyphomicrobiaceae bacterium]